MMSEKSFEVWKETGLHPDEYDTSFSPCSVGWIACIMAMRRANHMDSFMDLSSDQKDQTN